MNIIKVIKLMADIEKLHIRKQSFDGYCVGVGVEYPGIIVHAESDEDLRNVFLQALPGHKEALNKFKNKLEISVIEIESKSVGNQS